MAAEFWPEDYLISITVAKGAPLDDVGSPNLLVVESDIPWWGAFRSVEFRYFRDGARVYDIGLSNMGVTERDGRLAVSLELREPSKNVVDHAYRIEADFHPKAGKQFWPQYLLWYNGRALTDTAVRRGTCRG